MSLFRSRIAEPERVWEWVGRPTGYCLVRDDGMIVARIFNNAGEFEVYPQIGWFRSDVARFFDLEKAKAWAQFAVKASPP